MTELITYGRHKLQRTYFKEGFIDKWHGHCNDHPELEKCPGMVLSRLSSLWRLNGEGEWYDLGGRIYEYLTPEFQELFTATEVFNFVVESYGK